MKLVKISDLQTRLKEALDNSMSLTELAEKIGMSKQAISAYTTGVRSPKRPVVNALAAALHVDPLWLLGYDVPKNSAEQDIPDGFQPMPDLYGIPLLDSKIACGEPILCDSNIAGQVQVPRFIHADLALVCQGYSMTGDRIMDGDLVCIHRQPLVEDGEIAAVRIRDEHTLKHVYYNKDHNELRLKASNPAYPDQVYSGEDLDEIEIIGRAVAFVSKIQ